MRKNYDPLTSCAPGPALSCICILVALLSFSLHIAFAQSAQLLRDISEGEELSYNEYSQLTGGNGRFYFVVHGKELWTVSPNDPDDLMHVKTFTNISNLTMVGTNLFFVADGGSTGDELWKSNGTPEGTLLMRDIWAGPSGSGPTDLTNVRGTLYFAAEDGVNGRELWKTNGTPKGTVLVKDINPRNGSSNPKALTEMNGLVYFAAGDPIHGIELWRSNGTADGTSMVKDVRPGARVNSSPSDLVNVYGTLFFVAADANAGRELWRSDGTAAGTVLVKDILPGSQHSRIKNSTAVYRTLYFSATDGVHGQELWKSDGTAAGTVMVKDLTPGPAGSTGVHSFEHEISNFKNIYGTLFFTAYRKDTYYIWKSNGTANGTVPLIECSGPGTFQPRPMFTYLNNRIYFFNGDPWSEQSVIFQSMDVRGGDFHSLIWFEAFDAYNAYYPGLALVNSTFYIAGRSDPFNGFKMHRTDGTIEGTVMLEEDVSQITKGSNPEQFTKFNGKIYFRADHSFYQQHDLWVTDGTPEGTDSRFGYDEEVNEFELIGNNLFASTLLSFGLIKTDLVTRDGEYLMPSNYDKGPIRFLTQANGVLFFANEEGDIWRSDGTWEGTMALKDFHRIVAMDAVGGVVMFRVIHEDNTEELWRSDGTLRGTAKVKTIGAANDYIDQNSAVKGNIYFFIANDGIHGNELWRSDGTAEGTYMLADFNTIDPPFERDVRRLQVFDDALYVSALGNDGQYALYKTNGTAGVTEIVNQFPAIGYSIVHGDKLHLFTAEYRGGIEWTNLWLSDGTAEGTHFVKELNAVIGTVSHEVVAGVLYFSTLAGGPLWRTDGTECGTFTIDIGSRGASPIMAIGETLVFGSYDEQAGFEPHAYDLAGAPESPCGMLAADDVPLGVETQKMSYGYPNPFTNDFALRIDGTEDDRAMVEVFTLHGTPVEDVGEIALNTEHRIGQSWAPGVYLLQIFLGDKLTRHVLVKK